MNHLLQYLSLFFCILLFPWISYAQSNPYDESWRWIYYTTETGLPSNRVLDLIETPDGTTWASTEFGIAWFDGYLWHTVVCKERIQAVRTSSIIGGVGGTIYAEQDGNLFIGNKAELYHQPVYLDGKIIDVAQPVYLHGQGLLLIGESRLLLLRDSIGTPFAPLEELQEEKINNLFMGRNNTLWIVSDSGMYSYSGGKLRKRASFSGSHHIRRLVETKSGYGVAQVIFPKIAEGIWEWQSDDDLRYVHEIPLTPIESFDMHEDGSVFLVESQGTIMERVHSTWTPLAQHPPQMNNILTVRYRSNGDLWMGTEQGLYLFKAVSPRWKFIRYEKEGRWNNVNQILLTKDSALWAVTEAGIIIQYPNGKQQFIDHIGTIELKILTGLAQDNEGNIWVCSGRTFEGAFRWDGKEWKHFGYKQGLDAGYIHRIRNDRFGRLWFFGLERSDAVARNVEKEPGAYVLSNGTFSQWGRNQGVLSGRVYAVDAASDGTLWFATLHGLSKWIPDNATSKEGSWQHWTRTRGLRYERIYDVIVDKNDYVWFCDQAAGLGYFENSQPKYYTTSDGLVSNAVWEVKEDSSGKLWISTRNGISLFDGEEWDNIGASDGLTNTRLWSIIPSNDFVYIATYGDGIAILKRKKESSNPTKLIISQPLFRENITQVEWNAYAYWGEVPNERIETRYRLDNEYWSTWNTVRTVSFFDLSPGKHILEVQTKKVLLDRPSVIESVLIDVPYPYYFRPLFYIPLGLLVVIFIAMRAKYIMQRKKQESILKQSEERYRTLAESAQDPIYIIDKNHILQYINSYALIQAGLRANDVIGKHWEQRLPFKETKELREHIMTVLQEGFVRQFDHEAQFPTSDKWFSTLLTPLHNEQREIIGLMGISRDITTSKLSEIETKRLAEELQTAINQIKTLKGLLPICSHCKKIRDDRGYWNQLEKYLIQHSDATFTHGICPECIKQFYPEVRIPGVTDTNT